jgi:Tol biopolymer transport system component
MAPEQIKSTTIDARTDLYALGCVIYELVTDEVPYPRATTFDKAAEFFDAPVPDPRARRPDLPLWFARIIKRLLAKEPKQRFRSAMAVREALEGPHRLGGRHAALMALIMTLLVCAWGWYRAKHLPEWRPEVRPRQPAYEEMTNDPMISSDGQRLAYVSNRGDGQWRLYIEPMAGGQAQAILKGYHLYPLHWTQDGRALLGISGGFQVLRIAVPSGAVEEVAQKARDVDDCGGRIVVAASGIEPCPDCYRLIVLEGQGPARRQRELVRLSAGVQPEGLRCDRQGRQLTYYAVHVQMAKSQSDIYTMRLDESAPRRLTQDARTNRYPIFAPDGKSIVYSSQRSGSDELWEISVAGGEPIPLTTASGRLPVNYASRVTPTDISPDGKVLLYSEEFYALPLSAYSIDTQQRRRISQTLDFISQLCPMPDGREIIVRSERTDQRYAVAVSVEDGQERTLAPADVMALTPDGHELVYVIHDAQGAKIFAMPVTGGKARRISTLPEGVDHVAVDSAGWIHIRSGANEQHMRPLKVPLNGGTAVPEAAPSNSLVIPAPVGGWVMIGIPLGAQQYRWQLMAPGKSLMGPADRAFEGRHRVFWTADGASVLYWTGSEIRRHAIATGEERLLLRRELLDGSLALSPDGKTLYLAEWEGRSTRHMIVNFDKRPSLPH